MIAHIITKFQYSSSFQSEGRGQFCTPQPKNEVQKDSNLIISQDIFSWKISYMHVYTNLTE